MCARHKTGVICYSPMQSGLLTDTFTREHVARFAEDDWRRRSPDFNEPNLSRNLALREALRSIAHRHRTTVSAVAVAWTLAWPGVTGAIVGGRSPQQVDGWIGAASLQLTAADLREISDAIVRTGAGEGRFRNWSTPRPHTSLAVNFQEVVHSVLAGKRGGPNGHPQECPPDA
jgi:aryl-alcohol dehydrogenase-like predicted oxidoreductase